MSTIQRNDASESTVRHNEPESAAITGYSDDAGFLREGGRAAIPVTATIDSIALAALEQRIQKRIVAWLGAKVLSPWMNAAKAAEYLDWPKKRLYNLVSAGGIPHRKQGNRLLFKRDELDRWLDLHYEGASSIAAGPAQDEDL